MRSHRAAVAAVVVTLLGGCHSGARVRTEPAQPVRVIADAPVLQAKPGWQDLGPVPRTVNAPFGVTAWTGSELLLWGGNRLRGDSNVAVNGGTDLPTFGEAGIDHAPYEGLVDGVALDPYQHRWRAIPRAPLDRPLVDSVGVWDGHELIILGASCWAPTAPDSCYPGGFRVVAFDPRHNRWSTLPPPPPRYPAHDEAYFRSLGWTGRLALFEVENDLVGYDPSTQRWSTVGTTHQYADACASRHRIVTLSAERADRVFHFEVRTDASSGRWRSSTTFLPSPPRVQWPFRALQCTNSGAVLVQYDRTAFVFDATKLTVTTISPPGVHGNWYGSHTTFAPMGLDNNREIDLPKSTTSVFDAGSQVFAVLNDYYTCNRPACLDSRRDRVEVLSRR